MKYLIAYIIISVLFETILFLDGFRKLNKKINETDSFRMMKHVFLSTKSGQNLKKKVWNWYTVTFIIIPLFIFVCPLLFPFSLFTQIRKLLGIKTKLEKEVDVEKEQSEKAQKEAEEWMRTEGEYKESDIPSSAEEIIEDDLKNKK